jgi:DNA transposition AAA+ family ATPase
LKLRHHVPVRHLRSNTITPEYQAEVDRSTEKAMRLYERARRRLEAAEKRLAQLQEKKQGATKRRDLAVAAELVELRREELLRLEALMKAAPASAEHRGVRGFRPVPAPGRQF